MDIKRMGLTCSMLVVFACGVFGQQRPIHVGDTMPDLVINNIINQSEDKIRLRELYKNGLLIINFWGTYCAPCIKEMKFLDSLRAENKGQFTVLSVASEGTEVIKKFLSSPRNQDVRTSNLILATNDVLLKGMFPYAMLPHNIWIDKNGVVKAITSGDEITDKNILNFNGPGNSSVFRIKKDQIGFERTKEFHLADSIFTYRSMITPAIPGIGGSGGIDVGEGIRYFQFNESILNLYWNAYSNLKSSIRYNQIKILTNDSLRLLHPKNYKQEGSIYKTYWDWAEKNVYCYVLSLPHRVADTILRRYMFDDLERQFKIKAEIRNENIPCLVVTKVKGDLLKLSKRNSSSRLEIHEGADGIKRFKNARISDIMDWWYRKNNSKAMPEPFVYDLIESDNVYFDIVLDFSKIEGGISFDRFFSEFRKYGYRFKKKSRLYPVLILKDTQN